MNALLPPAYLLASILLIVGLRIVVPGPVAIGTPWNLIGLAPCLIGVALNVAGDRQFQSARTPMHPHRTPRVIVTTGVFRVSRNPMYLGMVLLVAGLAALLGRTTPFIAPALLWGVLRYGFIGPEERAMEARFGDAYALYRRHVRRWI